MRWSRSVTVISVRPFGGLVAANDYLHAEVERLQASISRGYR